MQKEGQNNLYSVLKDYIPSKVVKNKNRVKSWTYGYNDKYDVVVISKSGQIGDVVSINGLRIALPPAPEKLSKEKDYWERKDIPRELDRIQSIFQWNEMPSDFKTDG